MGGGIPKPAQSSEAVGDDSEGSRNDGRNSARTGSNLKGGGAVGVTIWNQELGGDRGDPQGPDGVSPLGGATDNEDDGKMWGRWRVGVSSDRRGNGIRGDPPHRSIY